MGAWGYGPFDCDDAGDFTSTVAKPIYMVLRRRNVARWRREQRAFRSPASYYYGEARAAIAMLLAAGVDYYAQDCAEALRRMLADSTWLGAWREPAKVRRALRKELAAATEAAKRYECALARRRRRLIAAHKRRKGKGRK